MPRLAMIGDALPALCSLTRKLGGHAESHLVRRSHCIVAQVPAGGSSSAGSLKHLTAPNYPNQLSDDWTPHSAPPDALQQWAAGASNLITRRPAAGPAEAVVIEDDPEHAAAVSDRWAPLRCPEASVRRPPPVPDITSGAGPHAFRRIPAASHTAGVGGSEPALRAPAIPAGPPGQAGGNATDPAGLQPDDEDPLVTGKVSFGSWRRQPVSGHVGQPVYLHQAWRAQRPKRFARLAVLDHSAAWLQSPQLAGLDEGVQLVVQSAIQLGLRPDIASKAVVRLRSMLGSAGGRKTASGAAEASAGREADAGYEADDDPGAENTKPIGYE